MSRRFVVSSAVGWVLIAIGLLVLVPAASGKAKAKPNLVLTNAKLRGNNYAFAGKTAQIRVRDTVENEGAATAAASSNELALRHAGAALFKDVTRDVPKLKEGQRDSGTGTAQIPLPADAKLGEYDAFLCADARGKVREKNELDNCEELGKFYIAKEKWAGSFSGTLDKGGGSAETWSANDARFSTPAYQADGVFTYAVQATVFYEIANTGGGSCTYSGAGVDGNPLGFLKVEYGVPQYTAVVRSDQPNFSYPIFADCGSGPVLDEQGPRTAAVLEVSTVTGGKPLPFGTTTLSGSQASVVEPDANFTWNLK